MRTLTLIFLAVAVAGCTTPQPKRDTYALINAELDKSAGKKVQSSEPDPIAAALLPPMRIELPKPKQPLEERFSIALNNVPAQQFFMGIVSGTKYSMLVHPEVSGAISVNLKEVTVMEALDAVRELYGYDYKVEGNRIYVKPLTLQTRVFQVNYLTGSRKGNSDIRVTSGSVSDSGVSPNTPGATTATNNAGNGGTQSVNTQTLNSSKISTTSNSDFWSELKASLEAIIGQKEGRSIVISPQSGVVVARGMWDELQSVAAYLRAAQLSVDRQVILDAKILEVELNDEYQAGVNWSAFRLGGNTRVSGGVISQDTLLQRRGTLSFGSTGNELIADPGSNLSSNAAGTLFGLAFQTSNFAALLSFLETQGNVHVLSSPRIATLNNQKAVLKVGRDEFFVTGISTTTSTNGNSSITTPSVTVQPFFSGVALDVTPQIDEEGNIILHIHPSVSSVTTINKPLSLGNAGTYTLPLASSSVSETDSIVRGRDGQVIAIGGLMRQATVSDRGQVPGAGDVPGVGALFRNVQQSTQKRELVILLKPTVVKDASSWSDDVLQARERIQGMAPRNSKEW